MDNNFKHSEKENKYPDTEKNKRIKYPKLKNENKVGKNNERKK